MSQLHFVSCGRCSRTADVPLTDDVMRPALLFFQDGWPDTGPFAQAEVTWIPRKVRELHGHDLAQIKDYLYHYPALRGSRPKSSKAAGGLEWHDVRDHGVGLIVEWRSDPEPIVVADHKTIDELGVARYRSDEDPIVTPAIGSMATGLHPFLALWAVLLALSALARYEPATWSRMIDIDRSAEANAIEHLLDEATTSIPSVVRYLLNRLR